MEEKLIIEGKEQHSSESEFKETLNAKNEENELLEKVSQLIITSFHVGKTKPQIIASLAEEGIFEKETATQMVELVVQKMHENPEAYPKPKRKWNGGASIVWGSIFLVGGIIATAASEGQVLFYGAIVVGVIYLIKGAIGY